MGQEQSYERSHEPLLSARKRDMVIEVRPERRRRWTATEKLQIMREACDSGAVAAHVMQRHGISSSTFYTWRKRALAAPSAGFLAVQVAAPPRATHLATPSDGMIEIFLPGAVRVRVDSSVDARALGVVLKAIGV